MSELEDYQVMQKYEAVEISTIILLQHNVLVHKLYVTIQ